MVRISIILALICGAIPAFGFALLGPYTPWMTYSNGYRQPGDLGGPMDLGDEYRWNLPVITYGFDREFGNYFGKRGVQEVEKAIAILTNLPVASRIDINAYVSEGPRVNYEAAEQGLLDLKSFALAEMLWQLGLNRPVGCMWGIRDRTNAPYPFVLIQRNFDPVSLAPTNRVNRTQYECFIFTTSTAAFAWPSPTYGDFAFDALAEGPVNAYRGTGRYYDNLTPDDVGGLRYLYSKNNVNVETLPADITKAGSTNRPSVTTALRPGIENLKFVKMTWNTNNARFNPTTNFFELLYVTNGLVRTQNLQRVVSTPDILFQCRDLGGTRYGAPNYRFYPQWVEVTDTTRWQNLADLNASASGAGPGIIPPGATITFGKVGRYASLFKEYSEMINWGAFDGTTNPPVVFQSSDGVETVPLDNYVVREGTNAFFTCVLLGEKDAAYRIETSTDLAHWTSLQTITNSEGHFSVRDAVVSDKRFFRALRVE